MPGCRRQCAPHKRRHKVRSLRFRLRRKLRPLPLLRLSPRDPLRWARAGTPNRSCRKGNGPRPVQKKRTLRRVGLRKRIPPCRRRGMVGLSLWQPSSNAMPLRNPLARGGPGYPLLLFPLALPRHFARLPVGAGRAVDAGRRGRRPLQDGMRGGPVYPPLCRATIIPVGADAHIRPFPGPIHHQAERKRISKNRPFDTHPEISDRPAHAGAERSECPGPARAGRRLPCLRQHIFGRPPY